MAPWPLAQGIIIGFLIAAGGVWAMRRGMADNRKRAAELPETFSVRVERTDEEKRWQWEAYKQLGHLEGNSFVGVKHGEDQVELLREILKSINRLADGHFNSRQ
ncbi:hypothetical protein XI06_16995 [Bradyrhizobium sp. CCBAU 11434]|nr:hypothetical protein [Bradyrhizobium sp. CCBAU 11434]